MNKNFLINKLTDAIEQSKGDWGRNHHLLERIKQNSEITNSDKLYLEYLLELEILEIIDDPEEKQISKKDKTIFLNPNFVKCTTCDKEIQLDEKSVRYKNFWHHKACYKTNSKDKQEKTRSTDESRIKSKKDPVMLILVGAIFAFLIGSVYFILGPISMVAMGLGGGMTVYHMIGATGKMHSKNKTGPRRPSSFLLFLLASPFVIGAMIAYEGYTLLESPTRIILLWAMTISFWSTMLFVPMAVLSKYREDIQPDVKSYPKVSVIIPAYNEEKVIANTIEALLETKYPKKEIPLTIGIITGAFGDDTKVFNFVKEQNEKKIFEIASHGAEHLPFTEFSKEQQNSQLKQSIQDIEEKLDVTPKTFIPPQNRFNEDTVQVTMDNGFTHFSSSLLHGESPPFPLKGEKLYRFPEISTTGTFDPEKNIFVGVPHEETLSKTLEGLNTYGFAVIVSHPQEFSTIINGTYTNQANSLQIDELKKLIEKIQQEGINIVSISQIGIDFQTELLPKWIKNNAGWWADGSIDDETFVQGIEYLIQENIIVVSEKSQTGSNEQNVPDWIKNNAGWWADGSIDDETFVQGIEYLVKTGIITY